MRRFLIIAAILVVVLGLAAGAYFYFSSTGAGIAVGTSGGTGLPNAGQITPTQTGTGAAGSTSVSTPVKVTARLVEVDKGPIVPGEVAFDIPAASASSTADVGIDYIQRQSGNVFNYRIGTGVLARISNKTVPGIESATWLPDASLAFVRYLSGTDFTTINTYALSATGAGGFFLAQNLADISVSSAGILTLASGVNGSIGSLTHTDGTHPSQAFSTPLSAVRISLAAKGQELVFTKPSATLAGDAYTISASGRLTRVAGPLNGLVAIPSPDGKWTLASYTNAGTMLLELVNIATGAVTPLPVGTVADKCAWAADSSAVYCGVPVSPPASYAYPDDWYQGAVHFSDRIWKIDVAGHYAQLVLDFPKETNQTLDATALTLSPSGKILVFLNKNDGSLWSYTL